MEVLDPENLSYLTQTTLSVDETNEIVEALRERFPSIQGPPREDICYATQNRQDAIKEVARRSDVVLVIGSDNSSNSNRLAEVARDLGTPAYLVDDETEVDPAWLEGARVVGLTSGASHPSASWIGCSPGWRLRARPRSRSSASPRNICASPTSASDTNLGRRAEAGARQLQARELVAVLLVGSGERDRDQGSRVLDAVDRQEPVRR